MMLNKGNTLDISVEKIAEECIAVRLRLLTRAISKLYNKALRRYGLTVSQMNILVAVSCLGQAKQQAVCQALHLDKSTLSRDAGRMRTQGWLDQGPGEDGRATTLRVTPAGKRLLERVFPAWQQAQQQAKALLGEQEAAIFGRIARAVRAKSVAEQL